MFDNNSTALVDSFIDPRLFDSVSIVSGDDCIDPHLLDNHSSGGTKSIGGD